MKKLMLIIISLFFSAIASAANWDLSRIESGTDGGFGFSGLHNASGKNVMSGAEFAAITDASGTYDDVSGDANFTFTLSNNTSFSLKGNLLFDNSGWLDSNSILAYKGLSLPGISATGDFGYKKGGVCCSGDFRPNSFKSALTVKNLNFLTLWGADGFDTDTGKYEDSTVGMDFRLGLIRAQPPITATPIPAAIWLFMPALFGVLGLGRKKVKMTTA